MFKKTPIALAILAICSQIPTALASVELDYEDLGKEKLNSGQHYVVSMSNSSVNTLDKTFKGKPLHIQTASNQGSTIPETSVTFTDLSVLKLKSEEKPIIDIAALNTEVKFGNSKTEYLENLVLKTFGHSTALRIETDTNGKNIGAAINQDDINSSVYFNAKRVEISAEGTSGSHSNNEAAIYLTGPDLSGSDRGHGELEFADLGLNYSVGPQEVIIESKYRAIFADHQSSITIHTGNVSIDGIVELCNGSNLTMGWYDGASALPQEWSMMALDNPKLLGTVTITNHSDYHNDAALIMRGNSFAMIAGKNVTIGNYVDPNDDSSKSWKAPAIILDYSKSNENTALTQTMYLSLYGEDTLTINGDIRLDLKGSKKGDIGLVEIISDGKLNFNGKIEVNNNKDYAANGVKIVVNQNDSVNAQILDNYDAQVEPDTQVAAFSLARSSANNSVADGQAELEPLLGTHLTFNQNAALTLTGDSSITTIEDFGGHLYAGTNNVSIKNLTLNETMNFYADEVKTGQFAFEAVDVVQPVVYSLRRMSSQEPSSKMLFTVGHVEDGLSAEQIAQIVTFDNWAENPGYSVMRVESAAGPQILVNVQAGEKPEVSDESDDNTTVAKSINDVAGLSVLAWRAQMNDVNKRLGDLRTYQGNHGGWARVYGSESKYGDLGLKSESTTIQVGADTKVGNNFYFGATASYSDGNGTLNNGSTEDRSYSFGLYGGWMGESGQFVDVIVKRANFKTDFDLRYTTGEQSTGSFDLWGTSVCAEYGWRLPVTENVWVEPQAEVTYGYMNDVTYTYSGVKATQEATESLVGRLGVALGTTFKSGSAYVKASVAHDWMGETEITMSNGNAAMKEDLGGTWGEFAVGGTYNFSNGWAVYGEFQTAHGSKMKTPWQYNVGARYVF